MYKSSSEWETFLTNLGAFFLHDGNPLRPHPLLTEGDHSSGFFNGSLLAFDHPDLAEQMSRDLADRILVSLGYETSRAHIKIVGPEYGAISVAAFAAARLHVGYVLARPEGEGKNKTMTLDTRFKVAGFSLLRVEDTITTGGSLAKTRIVCEESGASTHQLCGAWCNRSGLEEVDGSKIIAVINRKMDQWKPEDCPLCTLGSKALRPKEGNNWGLLTKAY